MQTKRLLLFFCLLIFSHFAMAQGFSVDQEIKKIDSLIEYNQLQEAEKKADKLYKLLNEKYNNKEYLEKRLYVRFHQGKIIDNQFEHRNALPIFIEILQESEKHKLYRIACQTNIRIAFNYEKSNNYDLAYKYLNEASKLCKDHQLDDLYSAILLRYALLHRFFGDEKFDAPAQQRQRLLELNFKGSLDSAVYYSEKTIQSAKKYDNEYDLNEAYVTLGILYGHNRLNDISKSNKNLKNAILYWKKVKNYEYVAMMNHNIALNYLQTGDPKKALQYNDSGYVDYNKMSVYYRYTMPLQRAKIFHLLHKADSAYHYMEIAYRDTEEKYYNQEISATKRLEEQYQNEKKEAIIKSKNQQMLLIGSLLTIIIGSSVLLYRKNRQINKQNKTINRQVIDLTKTLEQKQVLLSELQHRVKNNLQHVISILEIQKESVDFNNIDELIRGNQNRIHSMALLHKKLGLSENVNDVDVKKYVTELSELVKESYESHKKEIHLNIKCEIEKISIEKALPLGLIITELVSNSMKHAFKNKNIGFITIELLKDENSQKNKFYYADNGDGFDFNKTNDKGLGLEIIKGLIDQVDGMIETKTANGFELLIFFK